MKKLLCLLLSLMLLSCAAYAEEADAGKPPFEVELTEGVLTLRVNANPSTGYDWDFETDDALIDMLTCEYTNDEPELMGAPGQYVISFRAMPGAEGEATIILTERAPGEGAKSAQIFVGVRAEADQIFVDTVDYYAVDDESVLTVYLDENATTGYEWSHVIEDTRCLRLVSEEHISPEEAVPGAPGVYKAVFESTMESAGATALVFTYAQAWDGGATGRTISFDVWTTEAGTIDVDEVAMSAE